MPEQITFLLGAGASHAAVPIQQGIKDAIVELQSQVLGYQLDKDKIQFLEKYGLHESGAIELRETLRDGFAELINIIDTFGSIDQFAETLIHEPQRQEQLERVKLNYSAFFTLQQSLRDFDTRYIGMFNSLFRHGTGRRIPSNVKILSWNYDIQIERAFSKYNSTIDTLFAAQRDINLYVPNSHDDMGFSPMQPAFFKLNGTAYLSTGSPANSDINTFQNSHLTSTYFKALIHYWKLMQDRDLLKRNNLRFAYEMPFEKLDYMIKYLKQTTILVVIGYSFPPSNRAVDIKILDELDNLKQIIIQSKEPNPARDNLLLHWTNHIDPQVISTIDNVTHFHIPNDAMGLNAIQPSSRFL